MQNNDLPKIAVLIKTYLREKRLFNCVSSVERNLNWPHRIYIADDGPIGEEKQDLYNRLKSEGHEILVLDEYTPVTVARNMLVDMLGSEKYVLRLDDDFEINNDETHINKLITVLEHDESIGAVAGIERQMGRGKGVGSGKISSKQGHLKKDGQVLVKINRPPSDWDYQTVDGVRFAECDFCRNFLLIKREVFDKVRWDEDIVMDGEHIDFMLALKEAGWKLAFTPDSIHYHREDIVVEAINQYHDRRYTERGRRELFCKWGFYKIKNEYPTKSLLRRCVDYFRELIRRVGLQ